MCLDNDPQEMRRLLKGRNTTFTVYKILKIDKNNGIIKLRSIFEGWYRMKQTNWSPGWIISNTKRTKPCMKNMEMEKGIHTYREPRNDVPEVEILVKLTGYKKDLIGANWSEMLFTKVHLSKVEYNRVMRIFK